MCRAHATGGSGRHVSHWQGTVAAAGYEMMLQKQVGSSSHRACPAMLRAAVCLKRKIATEGF